MIRMDHMQFCDVAEFSLLMTDTRKACLDQGRSFVSKRFIATAKPKPTSTSKAT